MSPKNSKSMKSGAGRILIADDEEIAHLTLKRLLEPEGYTIDSAYGGMEALDELDSGYDLLILDVRMPDMDGIEVLREIRQRQLAIEVLILTGYATLESATQALSYGTRAYVMKPIENIAEFKSKIGEAIHASQLARDNRQFYDAIISGQIGSLVIGGKSLRVPVIRMEVKEIFQRLMEVIRDGVVFLDFDGNITFANVNFAQMLGESYRKLLGARLESYVVEEYQDKIIEVFTRLTSGEVAVSIPAQLKTSYGRIISVIISSSPIYYQMEYRGIAMVISDITEMGKVREKVELMANLVENAQHDMMLIANSEGQIMECNSLARSSFGYSQSQMLGLNMGVLFKSRGDKRWEEIIDSAKLGLSWRGEILGATKDGKEFPVEITVSKPPSKVDSDGSIICFVRDLTERKRAEEAEARIEELEGELSSLERLSGSGQISVTASMHGAAPLEQSHPDVFGGLTQQYEKLLDLALENRAFKVDHNISKGLRTLAQELGSVRAGPRDVFDIYRKVVKRKKEDGTVQKVNAVLEEGRLTVLELMGYLVSYYRNYASKEPTVSQKEEANDDNIQTKKGEEK